MEADELGRRLRNSRKARRLSQQAVAAELGVPRTAISQLEAGKRSVSTLELTKLADLYVRPIADLVREDSCDEDADVLAALYGAAPRLQQDPLASEQASRCIRMCLEGVLLEQLLGVEARSGPPRYQMPVSHALGEALARGEEAAEQERRRLGLGNAAVTDVAGLIASQGIWTCSVELPDAISGLSLRHASIGRAILANSSYSRGRKRFSYSREYAHALFDEGRIVSISSTANSSEMPEMRASAFAASFLMPRFGIHDALRNLGKGLQSRQERAVFEVAGGRHVDVEIRSTARSQRITYKDVALIAHRFGVCYRAALYRLKDLGYMSRSDSLRCLEQEQFGRRYLEAVSKVGDVGEPEQRRQWDRELCGEVVHLAVEAYRLGEISRGRVLDLSKVLRIEGRTLLELAEAAC